MAPARCPRVADRAGGIDRHQNGDDPAARRVTRQAGIGAASAGARAHIFYWAYLGFALSRPKMARERLETLLEELAALAEATSPASLVPERTT